LYKYSQLFYKKIGLISHSDLGDAPTPLSPTYKVREAVLTLLIVDGMPFYIPSFIWRHHWSTHYGQEWQDYSCVYIIDYNCKHVK